MILTNNRSIEIALGHSRTSLEWINTKCLWSDFVERLKTPIRTTESYQDYLKLSISEQGKLKDVGGFVGGTLRGKRRKKNAVITRDLVTLDLDNIPTGETDNILRRVGSLGCGALVYSTRKHSNYKPRLRVVIPTDRTMLPDEYEPVARKLAELIGIDYADPTTFDVSRLMYWASCSKDSVYVYEIFDAPFLSVDGILGLYENWKNVLSWPRIQGENIAHKKLIAKQEDPTIKTGIIGAFCRTYNVVEAMAKFIPTVYDATDVEDRFSYIEGSTTGGAVVYEDGKFLYSHHATDPCSGKLVNAWDLVRLHKFGELDNEEKENTPINKLPSWQAMVALANSDAEVSAKVNKERLEHATSVFDVVDIDNSNEEIDDTEWMTKLEVDKNGKIKTSTNNIMVVLENDTRLKGKLAYDEFSNRGLVLGKLPWDGSEETRLWTDVDNAGVRHYLETLYGLTSTGKVDDALALTGHKHRRNIVRDYLTGLSWDGVPRLDNLLHDYLGATSNEYTKQVMRKALVAAVSRAITGAVKFDTMAILIGVQGIGKSTFLAKLGKDWFCDSLQNLEGKEAAEIIQGQWIVELGELTAMSKTETNLIKQFLSKKEDVYRAAYGRHAQKQPRRCVFFGTSNDDEILKDVTGNRRFYPISVGVVPCKKSVFDDLDIEVDQIWAEAYSRYLLGESLILSKDAEILAEEAREMYRETSPKEGLIREFLAIEVPQNWQDLSLGQRRMFYQGNLADVSEKKVKRDKICALEIWCECFNGDPRYMRRQDSMEINSILTAMPEWTRNKDKRRYGYCGAQRGFERLKI